MENNFKQKIRELRIEKGLSQVEFAKQLGFGKSTINDWEVKGTEPCYNTLVKIADFFAVSLDYLLGRKEY